VRITEDQRRVTEQRIRAAMDRLLRGELPPGGKCDVKTLAAEAGVSRNALYTTYGALKVEFEQRRDRLREAGEISDPREAQIERLKQQVAELKGRVQERDEELAELRQFKIVAVSRIAAQHEELERLRRQLRTAGKVRQLRPGSGE
jgi:DNA repair exonuclease SbcCD ATPase subunit